MKLYDSGIKKIVYRGKPYRLKASFDRVLLAYDALSDELLSDQVQTEIALDILIRGKHPRDAELLDAILTALNGDTARNKSDIKTIDFTQDAPYIRAAFRQAYGIDLEKERGRMHWQTFLALFMGLPAGTRMMDIVGIRTRDVPAPDRHNAKQRAELIRMKGVFALRKTEAEAQRSRQSGFEKMAMALLSMAKGGEQK